MPYFIYKNQNIAGIGGVLPKVDDSKFNLGQAEKDGFYLGFVKDPTDVEEMKDYFVCFVDNDISDGFKLLGLTQVPNDPGDSESDLRSLTTEEQEKQAKAEKLMRKLKVRFIISSSVGDLHDLVADISKRVDILERLLMITLQDLINNKQVTSFDKTKIDMVNNYLSDVSARNVKTRVDIENIDSLFSKLGKRVTSITEIITNHYLQQKS